VTARRDRAGLRVLALVTDAYGGGGGIAQFNRDLFGAMARSALVREVVVLPRTGGPGPGPLPEKVRQLPPRAGKAGHAVQAFRAARSLGPFDVVFCGHLFAAPLAAAAARSTGAQYWQQLHGIEAWTCPGPMVQRAVEGATLVTAVSRHTRRLFLSWARNAPETVKVLPNTADERFRPGPKPARLLSRYGLTGKTVLLTVARLAAAERYKGHDRVIRAMAELIPTHPELLYVIAGDGDGRPSLELLAGQLGVRDHVRFVGHVPDDDLPDLYRAADLFVMPSTGEGFGIVFLQALASGIPVIGGDGDGSRDPLRDGKDGALVSSREPSAVARAIGRELRADRGGCSPERPFERARFQGFVARILEGSRSGAPAEVHGPAMSGRAPP
jgi:phosphatidylinositol alpha-1,6-mannosyltransferase